MMSVTAVLVQNFSGSLLIMTEQMSSMSSAAPDPFAGPTPSGLASVSVIMIPH